ncbi:transcription antitermination factor NusB [Agrococcus casei]|uniref:transcription antitermination factor NusB n=2 Tax=Microbacteriaceae TaxID=85023 RepID=UPI003F8E5EC9
MAAEKYPSRRKARKHAVEVVYAALVRDDDPVVLFGATASEAGWRDHPWHPFAQELVIGVADHDHELDAVIDGASDKWRISRMSRTDLAILRVATFELLHKDDVPAAVAISEAAHIAEELSAEGSPKFVQGVLSKIASKPDTDAAADDELAER